MRVAESPHPNEFKRTSATSTPITAKTARSVRASSFVAATSTLGIAAILEGTTETTKVLILIPMWRSQMHNWTRVPDGKLTECFECSAINGAYPAPTVGSALQSFGSLPEALDHRELQ